MLKKKLKGDNSQESEEEEGEITGDGNGMWYCHNLFVKKMYLNNTYVVINSICTQKKA